MDVPGKDSQVKTTTGGPSIPAPQSSVFGGAVDKEREVIAGVSEVGREMEKVPEEIERAGVTLIRKETIEIPPAVRKLGIKPVGPATPVPTTPTLVLPLSDQQIIASSNVPVTTALRWLATWCLRQLKKVHLVIKKFHGQVIRVVTKY